MATYFEKKANQPLTYSMLITLLSTHMLHYITLELFRVA